MNLGSHGEYVIIVSDEEPIEIVQALGQSGQLMGGRIDFPKQKLDVVAEAQQIAKQDIKETTSFERVRTPFRQALRAIIGYVYDEHKLPRDGGVDFGSGATGEMVHELLRDQINASTWAEVEVNPSAIAENKRRHPRATVFQGSYLDTAKLGLNNTLNIATGLSSLDATQFVPEAVHQIANTIQPGGYLLHVQDVRPGNGTGNRELRHRGMKPPFDCHFLKAGSQDVLCYTTPTGIVSVGELFRQNLGRAIEADPDLELIMNNWVVAKRPLNEKYGRTYYMNINMLTSEKTEEAHAVVTLARKKTSNQ